MKRAPAALACGLALLALAAPAQTPSKEGTVINLLLFAGTREGLWRSPNWGSDWELVRAKGLEPMGAVRSVLPLGPWVYVAAEGGLYLSEDFGESWQRLHAETEALAVLSSRYPVSDPTLFLATRHGLLKSEDGGRSFAPTPLAGEPVLRLEWPGPALLAGTASRVAVSQDAGRSFAPEGQGLPAGEVRALAPSSFFINDPVVFAGVGAAGVFRSADGARSWTPAGLAGRTVNDLAWLGPFLYAATDAGVFMSEDLGASWTPQSEGLTGRAALRFLFPLMPASGAEAFLATDSGVYWSGDGGRSWRATGLAGRPVLCLGTFPAPEQRRKK